MSRETIIRMDKADLQDYASLLEDQVKVMSRIINADKEIDREKDKLHEDIRIRDMLHRESDEVQRKITDHELRVRGKWLEEEMNRPVPCHE